MATICDARAYRIPNGIIVLGLLGSLLVRTREQGIQGMGQWCIAVGMIFLLFFPFSAFRMFGAGDVKLSMVLAGFFGVTFTLQCVFCALVLGAVYAVVMMLLHPVLFRRLQFLANYLYLILAEKKIRPYGEQVEDIPVNARIRFAIPMCVAYVCLLIKSRWNMVF